MIDRPKGYFPVPALSHLEGGVLELAREALTTGARRGLFRPAYVDRLLADPNGDRRRSTAPSSGRLALLELWLRANGI